MILTRRSNATKRIDLGPKIRFTFMIIRLQSRAQELDHDDFGSNRSKIMKKVIDSRNLERDASAKTLHAFAHPSLKLAQIHFFYTVAWPLGQNQACAGDGGQDVLAQIAQINSGPDVARGRLRRCIVEVRIFLEVG